MLSVFERACNLADDAGSVLSLVTSARGMTPFGVMIAAQANAFDGLDASSPVRVAGQTLSVGPLAVDFGAAELWPAAPDWPALRLLLATVAAPALSWLADFAIREAQAGTLLDLYRPAPYTGALAAGLLERARRGGVQLAAGLHEQHAGRAAEGVRLLAGLGGGLTPAGDDYIVGALLAAWAGLFGPGAERLAGAIAAEAAPLTNTLSAAYLSAAARGECAAEWHAVFVALAGQQTAALAEAAHALLAIGHSSGADGLAGFIASCMEISP